MTPILPSDVDASAPSRVSEKAVEAAAAVVTPEMVAAGSAATGHHVGNVTCEIIYRAMHALATPTYLQPHPNAGQAVDALNQAALTVEGWTTAVNSKHVRGWGHLSPRVAEMLAQRDGEIGAEIRSLAPLFASPIPAAPVQSEVVKRTPQRDHIAAVMLQKGSPEQQAEALAYVHGKLSITSPQPVEPAPGADRWVKSFPDQWMHPSGFRIEMMHGRYELWDGPLGKANRVALFDTLEEAMAAMPAPGAGEDAEPDAAWFLNLINEATRAYNQPAHGNNRGDWVPVPLAKLAGMMAEALTPAPEQAHQAEADELQQKLDETRADRDEWELKAKQRLAEIGRLQAHQAASGGMVLSGPENFHQVMLLAELSGAAKALKGEGLDLLADAVEEAAEALRNLLNSDTVIVSREPTQEMLNAAVDIDSFKLGDISPLGFRCSPQEMFRRAYRAMIDAALTPANPAGER